MLSLATWFNPNCQESLVYIKSHAKRGNKIQWLFQLIYMLFMLVIKWVILLLLRSYAGDVCWLLIWTNIWVPQDNCNRGMWARYGDSGRLQQIWTPTKGRHWADAYNLNQKMLPEGWLWVGSKEKLVSLVSSIAFIDIDCTFYCNCIKYWNVFFFS